MGVALLSLEETIMITDVLIISMLFIFALYAIGKAVVRHEEQQRKEFFKKLSQRKVYIGSTEDLARLRNWGESNAHK